MNHKREKRKILYNETIRVPTIFDEGLHTAQLECGLFHGIWQLIGHSKQINRSRFMIFPNIKLKDIAYSLLEMHFIFQILNIDSVI